MAVEWLLCSGDPHQKGVAQDLTLTWMGTMPAFLQMLMPVSPPVKLMQFTAGCVCMPKKHLFTQIPSKRPRDMAAA